MPSTMHHRNNLSSSICSYIGFRRNIVKCTLKNICLIINVILIFIYRTMYPLNICIIFVWHTFCVWIIFLIETFKANWFVDNMAKKNPSICWDFVRSLRRFSYINSNPLIFSNMVIRNISGQVSICLKQNHSGKPEYKTSCSAILLLE